MPDPNNNFAPGEYDDDGSRGATSQEGTSDLSGGAKDTLANYLHDLVGGNLPQPPNTYTPPEDNEEKENSIPTLQGTPALDPSINNKTGYIYEALTEAQTYFENISGGGDPETREGGFFDAETLQALIDKNSQVDGHKILAEIAAEGLNGTFDQAGEGTGNDVAPKTSSVLHSANRFNPGSNSPYVQGGSLSEGMYSLQKELGRYNPAAESVVLSDLAKIPLSMMLAAAGHGPDARNPDNESSDSAIGAGILTQLGDPFAGKIKDMDSLRPVGASGFTSGVGQSGDKAKTTINQDGEDGIRRKGKKTDSIAARNRESYGQLNTYLEPFGGPLPIGMIVLAALAGIAVLVAGIVIMGIFTLIFMIPGLSGPQAQMPPEPLPSGATPGSKDFGTFTIGKLIFGSLRIPKIKSGNTLIMCLIMGALRFYMTIMDAVSSGYFITVTRSAIRDLEQIERAMAEADFGSVTGILESIFVIIEAFGTSTTFQFLNTMTFLGDIVYLSGGLSGGGDRPFSGMQAKEAEDGVAPTVANLHTKTRTYVGDRPDYRQALRFGSLPSAYLAAQGPVKAGALLGNALPAAGFSRMPTDAMGGSKWKKPADGSTLTSRFSAEERMEIEDRLETYYVPFYFHDLRTNEIIALHSFVEGISDNYSPKWNEVKGMGRMDPVLIYEGTERKIGFSFYVAATGPEDLDEMYYAINRLVMMLYPQWSRGTQKETLDKTAQFIQPFSQVPTASPIIRIRVGELFRSNNSLYSMSRLFGLSSDSFTIDKDAEEVVATAGIMDYLTDPAPVDEDGIIVANEGDCLAGDVWGKKVSLIGGPDPNEAIASAIDPTGLVPNPAFGFSKNDPVTIAESRYKFSEASDFLYPIKSKGKFRVKGDESVRKGFIASYFVDPVIDPGEGNEKATAKKNSRVRYVVELSNTEMAAVALEAHEKALPEEEASKATGQIICAHDDLKLDYEQYTLDLISEKLAPADSGGIPNPFAPPPEPATIAIAENIANFFKTENNGIVRSFQESGGRGLAGAITNFDIDWNMAEWDVTPGRRAPIYCKITIGFAPIHDIPLGLDADGIMRAPAYNVGNMVQNIFGTDTSIEEHEARLAANTAHAAEAAARVAAATDQAPSSPTEGDVGSQ